MNKADFALSLCSSLKIKIPFFLLCLIIFFGCGNSNQTKHNVTFKLNLFFLDTTNSAFITGNQVELGNWKADSKRMKKINDSTFEKTIQILSGKSIEFKFTAGSWWQEALDSNYNLANNSGLKITKDTIITTNIYGWKNKFKQGKVVFDADRFNPNREFMILDEYWKYHPGDNFKWASKNFNDSNWQKINLREIEDNSNFEFNNIGWFRFHFVCDTSLWNKSIAIIIDQLGASEFYYNGKLLFKTGEIGDTTNEYNPLQMRNWKYLNIDPTEDHLFSVRFANNKLNKYSKLGFSGLFTIYLSNLNKIMEKFPVRIRAVTAKEMIFTVIPLLLFLLHIFLYAFNPKHKENLYYAICMLGFAGITFFGYQKLFSFTPEMIIMNYRLNGLSVPIAIFFGLLMGFQIRYNKLPKRWILFFVLFVVLSVYQFINPLGFPTYLNYVYFVLTMGDLVITSLFSKTKTFKKGSLILLWGFISLIIFVVLQIFVDYNLIELSSEDNQVFVYGMVGLAISMSLFLSYNFAQINKNLENQLIKVKLLSEKTIEQERIANKLEIERRIIEIENERKSKELESARTLQLSLLPKSIPQFANLELDAFMQTASEVGGDYYDIISSNHNSLIIAVGDATGHGVKAGTLVAVVKSLLFEYANKLSLTEILSSINNSLLSMRLGNLYMGLTLLKISEMNLEISSAGMPPIIIYRKASDKIEEVIIKRMPLGATDKIPFNSTSLIINKGDIVAAISDGLPELFNKDKKMYEYERVKKIILQNASKTSTQIIEKLNDEAEKWLDGYAQSDDITYFIIKFN